jgi:cold shock CspA family protein
MRTHGSLTKWNDDRGFGFITPAKGPPDIFVHISEFPREGGRPALNELISFEVQSGPDGKKRAVRVMRPGQKASRPPANRARQQPRSSWLSGAITFIVIAGLGAYVYSQFSQRRTESRLATMEAVDLTSQPASSRPVEPARLASLPETSSAPITQAATPPASPYSCDGRTVCSQMRSCAEATFFIRNCPGTKMDGNNDGVPCEQQFCN